MHTADKLNPSPETDAARESATIFIDVKHDLDLGPLAHAMARAAEQARSIGFTAPPVEA